MPPREQNAVQPDSTKSKSEFDVAVIGGGVVGLAILRRLTLAGLQCVLLEMGTDILSGASKGNSALLHTGFDAPPESLQLACMQSGYAEYLAIREKLNLPLLETSALLVAWNDAELAALQDILDKAHANGVTNVQQLSGPETRAREPRLATTACGSLLVPGEHVIDPWSAPLAYAYQALAHGAVIHCNAKLAEADYRQGSWLLTAGIHRIEAGTVINAAGLFGDQVEKSCPNPAV